MSKGLKALENIKREAGFPYFSTCYDVDMWREDFATCAKEIKALEIINKKFKISVYHSRHTKTGYEMCIEDNYDNSIYCDITEEEYNFSKEVLK